jgi:hypothetical protein
MRHCHRTRVVNNEPADTTVRLSTLPSDIASNIDIDNITRNDNTQDGAQGHDDAERVRYACHLEFSAVFHVSQTASTHLACCDH